MEVYTKYMNDSPKGYGETSTCTGQTPNNQPRPRFYKSRLGKPKSGLRIAALITDNSLLELGISSGDVVTGIIDSEIDHDRLQIIAVESCGVCEILVRSLSECTCGGGDYHVRAFNREVKRRCVLAERLSIIGTVGEVKTSSIGDRRFQFNTPITDSAGNIRNRRRHEPIKLTYAEALS